MSIIYNCDIMDGFKKVDDSSVDLIVTSPPYNVGIEYDSWNDTMPEDEYYAWCNKWLSECYSVLSHFIEFIIKYMQMLSTPLRK